jgi:hypothetical protein
MDRSTTNWPGNWLFTILTTCESIAAQEVRAMISGGNATVYVSKMDTAVRFYCEILGLKLTLRH